MQIAPRPSSRWLKAKAAKAREEEVRVKVAGQPAGKVVSKENVGSAMSTDTRDETAHRTLAPAQEEEKEHRRREQAKAKGCTL